LGKRELQWGGAIPIYLVLQSLKIRIASPTLCE